MNKYIDLSQEVKEAMDQSRPIVALESTIISHGMPYPQNLETAMKVEEIIREEGAVPATIAIIDGRIKVGLNKQDLEIMATSKDIAKVSRRDMAAIISKKQKGATTVASTMIIADMAGIRVFVTGGIGGVHREAQQTFDISADLEELANTNVAVVCAGAKSILDIGLTLEYLETRGVPVLGYKTGEFPAFYTRQSGYGVDYSVDSPRELAHIISTKWELGLEGGLVIGNPIPKEYEMDYEAITNAIEGAVKECKVKNITGKGVTPFILAKVKEITQGRSLTANIELVYNNARLGAQIAKELRNF